MSSGIYSTRRRFELGSIHEVENPPGLDVVVNALARAFGKEPATLMMTIIVPGEKPRAVCAQIVSVSHLDQSGYMIYFRANVSRDDGFGSEISCHCDCENRKAHITVEKI